MIRCPRAQLLSCLAFSALLVAASPARADLETEARTFLAAFHDAVDAVVSDEATTPEQKRQLVMDGLDRHLDHGFLAARALGPRAQDFTREQFADFSRAYARFLTDFFTVTIARSERERAFAVELGAAWSGDTLDPPPERPHAIIDTTPAWKPVLAALEALRPGGRLLCLEFSRPAIAALRPIYDTYSFQILPRLGAAVAGDADAYRYLVESIRAFPDQDTLAEEFRAARFGVVRYRNLSGGIVALHSGWRT